MFAPRAASFLVGLAFVAACGSPSGNKPVAATSATPTLTTPSVAPSPAAPTPSAAPSPSPVLVSPMHPVIVEFMDNHMINRASTVTLYRPDGTVVASLEGHGDIDEHPIDAYLVIANDSSGKEWAVDTSGLIRPVAPAAAALLTPNLRFPLVLDSSTAIVGCYPAANGDCTAEVIDLGTGAVRPLLTAAATTYQDAMAFGPSLTVLDASYDRQTIWFREVSRASGAGPSVNIAAVNLSTGNVARHSLPVALIDEQALAISRDGKWVAGQEDAGLDSNHVAMRHLHLVSMATGADTDVQGSAPYVAGLRPPSIQFAPDGAAVMWWGALNSGGQGNRVNVTSVNGVGTTISVTADLLDPSNLSAVFWLDATRLVAQSLPPGATVAIDKETGDKTLVIPGVWPTAVNAVMYGSPGPATP